MKDYELVMKLSYFCHQNHLRLPEVTIYPCHDTRHGDLHAEVLFHLELSGRADKITCPVCYTHIDIANNKIKNYMKQNEGCVAHPIIPSEKNKDAFFKLQRVDMSPPATVKQKPWWKFW